MFCSDCGKSCRNTDKFCTQCGKGLAHSDLEEGTSAGPASTPSVAVKKSVKSFEDYRKEKGAQWKSRVSKSGSTVNKEDVVINISLMEYSDKDHILKPKRGKKLPLRVLPTVSYSALLKQAREKWKNFYSNIYDENQVYHLLYEDGSKALWVPGTERKEFFMLKRYKEEMGKDYKRITMFLCTDREFKLAEGISDEESSDDESSGKIKKYFKYDFDYDHCPSDSGTSMKTSLSSTSIPDPVMVDLTDIYESPAEQNEKSVEQDKQTEHDAQLAEQLQELYEQEQNELNLSEEPREIELTDNKSVIRVVSKNVDQSGELFLVIRRGSPLGRILTIWKREMRNNPSALKKVVRIRILGEQGIDSGAMALEFFTETLRNIGISLFPLGAPVDSTLHVQNGDFQACGQIVAASLAQGGPALKCLDNSVFTLMTKVQKLLPQDFDADKHLMLADKELLDMVCSDVNTSSSTIIEHGYTGRIDSAHADEIVNSMIVSIVSRRLVCVREFMEGLKLFGVARAIQKYPEACRELFVKGSDDVDANYLFSSMCPEYSEDGSSRKQVEEAVMDNLQDFLFSLEDDTTVSGYTEAIACNDDDDDGKALLSEERNELFQAPDLTPAGIMGWLTGQKHKPLNGELITIKVKFDHNCTIRNPQHKVCFPQVGACAKVLTLPVSHMKTAKEFSEVFLLALSKGQSFGKA